MNIVETTVAIDISPTAFQQALVHLRALPYEATLYCSYSSIAQAHKVKQMYDCKLVLIPDELAKTKYCWAVVGNGSMYWSPGIP